MEKLLSSLVAVSFSVAGQLISSIDQEMKTATPKTLSRWRIGSAW
jgi:hypothetical protein